MTKNDEIVLLKERLREQMHTAAANGTMNGHDLLGALMAVSAEFVARVDDPGQRAEFVQTVVGFFPHAVNLERIMAEHLPPGKRITLQ